ncbi:PEP/pyruvate-binding domain-containing protein [Staphylococcus equorum]|uniref:Phosphoenolpyruvate synthase n=1 Tax=Staphylococcus equorum TaxID=246432 RepID=A0A9X4L9F8_9STAP|nr:PEP/pyruvate-binding domain-containing protein [Staphylococcus equorum]MDG0842948.1 PEP/pyruvate-binding domain-containing protein [Staphylococcus equorum]MDG0859430.1 PEP/pyruvate-binding domain-containing protein [Staphylococcus equorum]
MFTQTFDNAENITNSIGSKALNLIKLKQADWPVPNGFIVLPDTFHKFIEFNKLSLKDSDIQQKIIEGKIPESIYSEIIDAFNLIKNNFNAVAVRSSSSAEDLENASFAGQYETYLNVQTKEDLIQKIKLCWASIFAERVQSYLNTMAVDANNLSMSIVVQGLLIPETSGVIFSQNPITDNLNECIINVSYGLGESIVSGMVTPDTFIVNKSTCEIAKQLGLKEMKMLASEEGISEVETTELEKNSYCINDNIAQELAKYTQKLESSFGYPVDIEFGIEQERIYILQVRPITT